MQGYCCSWHTDRIWHNKAVIILFIFCLWKAKVPPHLRLRTRLGAPQLHWFTTNKLSADAHLRWDHNSARTLLPPKFETAPQFISYVIFWSIFNLHNFCIFLKDSTCGLSDGGQIANPIHWYIISHCRTKGRFASDFTAYNQHVLSK